MDFLTRPILPADASAMEKTQSRLNNIAKPIGSLGELERALIKIAGLQGSADIDIKKRAVLAFCADNGVIRENIAITPPHVTRAVAENMARGMACVCLMGKVAHADVIPVDVGMFEPSSVAGVIQRRVRSGSHNITAGAAMTRDEAMQAIQIGADMVIELANQGYKLIAVGEMGVGNTTTSSAVCSVLLNREPREVTGVGAGLSDEGLTRKIQTIERAIAVNAPDPDDALDVLMKVGGLDMAAMCGAFIGGAMARVPMLIDGFISATAALVAVRLRPEVAIALQPSHVSAEPAGALALSALGLKPLITAGLRLGEGTGAVAAMPMLDMALMIYNNMMTFAEIGM